MFSIDMAEVPPNLYDQRNKEELEAVFEKLVEQSAYTPTTSVTRRDYNFSDRSFWGALAGIKCDGALRVTNEQIFLAHEHLRDGILRDSGAHCILKPRE
ncbi:hypothetical protein B0A50_00493 [Salinomyces thailandicus]|uniref:Uncharacterized protein n=1 Tax=Salinomyces thailandicus TaxID=706561 RepID=A0A4U0UEG3_9PEZI|nr:hypothetical protein B0A50_00493 [Salinomyces thailandica]